MRRPLILLLAALASIVAGDFVVWRWAEGQLAGGFAAWSDGMRAQGWTVAAGPAERGGWPLAAELTLPDLNVAGGDAMIPAGMAWTGARVTLRVDLLHPRVASVRLGGRQALRVGGAPEIPFTADRFVVTVPLAYGEPPRSAALDAARIRLGPPADGLTVGLLQGEATWRADPGAREPAASVRLSAEAIALPPPPAPQAALGGHIGSATVEGVLAGPLPASAGSSYATAAAWRDGGSTLELRRIAVGWGPLGVTGGATLTLDGALQPAGTANLRLVGYDDALAALVGGHVIQANAARAAKAVLGLLARPAQDGGAAGVEVPVTLRDQALALGPFRFATVPKLVWPDAPGSANVD